MSKKYTDKELLNLIAEVEVEFKKHLQGTEEKVQKTESAAVAAQPASTEEKTVAKSEGHDYDAEDMEEVAKLYGSMTKAEAEIHYKQVKKAVFGDQGEPVAKSEDASGEETKLLKSEVDSLKKENGELKKSFENVVNVLNKVFGKGAGAPKQKAVTSLEVVKKSEEETKSAEQKDFSKITKKEISDKLTAKIRSGKLEKNDKEAIEMFYENSATIDAIKHLL